jgi:hypothetical protein
VPVHLFVPDPYASLTPAELAAFSVGPSYAPVDSDDDNDDDEEEALRDRGSIVPIIYLCVSRTEALLMASNTSYHKRYQNRQSQHEHLQ